MSTCRSCGAPVLFARAVSGSWMILDAEPREDGNVQVTFSPHYGRHEARVFSSGDAAHEAGVPFDQRYLDHHATCPDAEKWSRKCRA